MLDMEDSIKLGKILSHGIYMDHWYERGSITTILIDPIAIFNLDIGGNFRKGELEKAFKFIQHQDWKGYYRFVSKILDKVLGDDKSEHSHYMWGWFGCHADYLCECIYSGYEELKDVL